HHEVDLEQRLLGTIEYADLVAAHLDRLDGRGVLHAPHRLLKGFFRQNVHGHGPFHQRRSKRRRSTMAAKFIAARKSNRMMMAPEVRSTKARSASLAHI